MPLFHKRSRLDNTVATPVPPPPQETIIHNYAPSRWLDILAWFLVVVVSVFLAWEALVYLVGQAGYNRPEQAAANGLGGLVAALVVLGSVFVLVKFIAAGYWAHRERMEEIHLQALEKRARLAQAISPQLAPGMTEEDKRRYRAVMMAMARAYREIDEKGRLRTKSEPWSKRGVGDMVLLGEGKKVGEDSDLARWVKPFLLERNVLLDDRTVNLARFPDLVSVETALVAEFGRPIMLFKPGDGNGAMNSHYVEKGTHQSSWG